MALIRYSLWNSLEQRVRVGWRLILYTLFWLYAPRALDQWIGPWLVMLLAGAGLPLGPAVGAFAPQIVAVFLKLVVVLAGTWLAARYLDRRPFAGYGLRFNRRWWLDFCFGLALGALLMSLVFGVEWLAGWVVVHETLQVALPGLSFTTAIVGALLLFVVVAVTEELLARGYHLLNLAEALHGTWLGVRAALVIAWLISSSLFGLLHIFNPNATWYTTLALMWAGMLFGLGYLLTGSLALPIALHITWNFFQGNIFGFPVSGNQYQSVTVFAIEQRGPVLWTGGAFGPEAGLLGVMAVLLGCGLTLWWVRWQYREVRLTNVKYRVSNIGPPNATLDTRHSILDTHHS